eukprot:TRINITY_DN29992_c0_g1_i1.p1 TRINITY_DN29992_c0_g1~~TRINITY_DN29992_c0_g1_i1.p1  ORF type:complete len:269 (+),score=80.83 TRINITY_DN29992_c0_g1_i1:43-807(+)
MEVKLHPAQKRRSITELRRASALRLSQAQSQSQSQPLSQDLDQPGSQEPPSPERRTREDELVPRRTLSATEWGKRMSKVRTLEQEEARVAPEVMDPAKALKMDDMVAALGRRMREKKGTPRRRLAQIYAARSAIIIALGTVCTAMEDVKKRSTAASALVTIKDGVSVTAATRSAALKGIKVFLNQHYRAKVITKEQFKACTIKALESFLQHICVAYPKLSPTALASVINTRQELAYMEALCNESVKRVTGRKVL